MCVAYSVRLNYLHVQATGLQALTLSTGQLRQLFPHALSLFTGILVESYCFYSKWGFLIQRGYDKGPDTNPNLGKYLVPFYR